MIKNIFIHLDDSNTEIQEAVYEVLKTAAPINRQIFIKIVFQKDFNL
jgi:hypothetical protein